MTEKQITPGQFFGFALSHAKIIPTIIVVMTLILTFIWNSFGEKKVQEKIDCSLSPIKIKVESNQKNINNVAFEIKQMSLIIKRTSDPQVVQDVENETEAFRPLSSGESIYGR